jgi:outer membrane protein OmpA-like peptidoglycan-associated protein
VPGHRLLGAALAVVVAVGACSSDDDGDEARDGEGAATTTAPGEDLTPESVVDEVEVALGPATLTVAVHPLVRTDDGLVLTLDVVSADDPAGSLGRVVTNELRDVWRSRSGAGLPLWVGLRLLDLPGDRALTPAVDADGETLVRIGTDGEGDRLQLAFGDPDADELALLVPQGGLVTDLPVIDGDVPVVDEDEALDLDEISSAPVVPLSSYTVDLATTTRTESELDQVTIELGADVLFELDSADLTPVAQDAIAAAAESLALREPGPVQVVGHTDSSGSDAYNLDLSRRRADAVAAALRTRIDGDAYPLEVEGRGESEPVADNGSEIGRATNRRVALSIATALQEAEATDAPEVDPPPIDGPVATGAEGVDVEIGRTYRITAPAARVVDGHLVVELRLEATDDEEGSALGPAIFEGAFPTPPGLDPLRTMVGVTVAHGTEATTPALHAAAEAQPDQLLPLTDLVTFSRLDGGDVRTSVLVYPRGVPVGDVVTIQLVDLYNDTSWRLTDIPVEG